MSFDFGSFLTKGLGDTVKNIGFDSRMLTGTPSIFNSFMNDTLTGKSSFVNNLAKNNFNTLQAITPKSNWYDNILGNTKNLLGNQTFWNGLGTAGSLWSMYNDGKMKKKMFNMAQDQYNFNKQMVLDEKKRQKQMSDNLANVWKGR